MTYVHSLPCTNRRRPPSFRSRATRRGAQLDRSPPRKFSSRGENDDYHQINENMALVNLEDRSCSDRALTIPSDACCAQYSRVFVPATPYDGCLPQPSFLHFLLWTLTIPFGACCAQYSLVFIPAPPYDGIFLQPSVLHFLLLQTLTIPFGACCTQYSFVFVPATPYDGCLPQPSVLHVLMRMFTIPSSAC